MDNNIVILMGESHYHGLNLLRSFGEKNIRPYGIIIGDHLNKFLESSKYWEKIIEAPDNEQAVELLIRIFSGEEKKPLVLPWSDGILCELDNNYDRLKDDFVLASINGIEGEISRWLDKKQQALMADILGLDSSPVEVVSFPLSSDVIEEVNGKFRYPLFLKPATSIEGSKSDMKKIDTPEELSEYCNELESRGFSRILIQEYLNIDTELDFMGYCSPEGFSYSVAEKIRTWPISGGAACYGRIVAAAERRDLFDGIVKRLSDFGYRGPFDMDLFIVGDRIYFNEINWRSSANVFGATSSGNNYPYFWYLASTGRKPEEQKYYSGDGLLFMNEFLDFQHVIRRKISFRKWLNDRKQTTVFAFKDRKDPKPYHTRLTGAFTNKLFRRKRHQQGETNGEE